MALAPGVRLGPYDCTLHDVGSQDGIDFLVMEHLEGEIVSA